MRARRSLRLVALTSFACAAWLGCNAILGNESAEFDPDAAARLDGASSGNGGDGTTDGPNTGDGSSSGGDATIDGDADAGACDGVDFQTDPAHCGSCGHSCRGGGCALGKCLPFKLATDEQGPFAITVDATSVYWINYKTGDVWSVPINGGNKTKMYDGPVDIAGNNIIAFGGNVYFGNGEFDGGVLRCPAPTCKDGPFSTVPNLDAPTSIAITDAGTLYFVEFNGAGGIKKCNLPCSGGVDTVVPNGQGFPDHVAVHGDDVYWTTITPFPPRMRKLVNGTPTPFQEGPIENILPTATEVFFMEQGAGPSAINVDGGPVRRLRGGSVQGRHMVFFGNAVLASESTANQIYTCDLAGCVDAGTVLSSGQQNVNVPRGVTFDATYIYWANEGTPGTGGSIMRLAR